jgi:hypothetical protein
MPETRRKPILAKYRIYEALRRSEIDDMSWFHALRADWNYAVTYKLCNRWVGHWWKPTPGVLGDWFPGTQTCRICKISQTPSEDLA